ncbi:MAG: efflux RND transporter periplasmic adaptor subunit [Candidatus Obscuribacterales bacterium]|nr:efflux RND transporter periplasmic adaptor subunit [Candidatus Obscuribacterales bacterium]
MSREFSKHQASGGTVEERPSNLLLNGSRNWFSKNPLIWSLSATIVIAAACFFYFNQTNKPLQKADESSLAVLTVSTAPVERRIIQRSLAVNGSISAWDPLAIGAEVAQLRVDSIAVEEGAQVRAGQVLATLNSSILKAQLAQQKAHLAADEAALRKAIQPNRVEDLNTWRAALSQAEANLSQEEANLLRVEANAANFHENARRYGELRKLGAVSQMDADTKATEAKTSSADVTAAKKRVEAMKYSLHQAREKLAMAERGGRQEDIVISKASLEETKAKIAQLQAQIDQTIIRAPDDGKIVKREVHLGEISSSGKTMFLMVRDNRFELRALVPEVDIPLIKAGMPVKMSSSGKSSEFVIGRVREISPSVDEKSRLGVARIDIPAAAEWMKPGLFYHAEIDLGKEPALVVPSKAVLSRSEKDVVFVYDGSKAVLKQVKIGQPLADDRIEIRSGLQEGEEVIISGAGFMKDGDKVRTVPEGSGSSR